MCEIVEVIIDTGGIPFSPRVKSDDGKEYLDCPVVVTDLVYTKAKDWYGEPLPYSIEERIATELYGDIVFKIIKEDFENSGVYKAGSKEVKLNFSVIDDDVIGMYKPKTTEDYTYCFNYQAIKDLLHEIQHADQEHLYEYRYKPYNHFEDRKFFIIISALDFLYNAASTTDESSYEYRKLSIGKPADKSYKEHLLDLYNELYTVIPTERMAELEACIEIREILKEIGKFNPDFGLGENYKLFFQAYGVTGEKKKVYPTEVYYDIFAYEDDMKRLVEG